MKVFINKDTGEYTIHCVSGETKPVGSVPDTTVAWEQDTDDRYYYSEADREWHKVGAEATPVTPIQFNVTIPAAEALDDSEATDVATLVTDFNALLAKLRTAGLMEAPEEQ